MHPSEIPDIIRDAQEAGILPRPPWERDARITLPGRTAEVTTFSTGTVMSRRAAAEHDYVRRAVAAMRDSLERQASESDMVLVTEPKVETREDYRTGETVVCVTAGALPWGVVERITGKGGPPLVLPPERMTVTYLEDA